MILDPWDVEAKAEHPSNSEELREASMGFTTLA
jgi:hypothetical protein